MSMLARGFVGAVAGYVVGFLAGMLWYCNVQDNNLCGIIAIVGTGPIGALVGSIAGALMSRRK